MKRGAHMKNPCSLEARFSRLSKSHTVSNSMYSLFPGAPIDFITLRFKRCEKILCKSGRGGPRGGGGAPMKRGAHMKNPCSLEARFPVPPFRARFRTRKRSAHWARAAGV